MAIEHSREREPLTPLRDGEFHKIQGIGPGIEQRLNAAGIQTFRQLASLTPDEICALLNRMVGITAERIAHQDWPGKAQQFAEELAKEESNPEQEDPCKHQHYASFMVQLLQDENHDVRRTRLVHVQSSAKDSWAGWDAERFDRWIREKASIAPLPNPQAIEYQGDTSITKKLLQDEIISCNLIEGEVYSPQSKQPNRFFNAGQPFEIRLSIDLKPESQSSVPLCYEATVNAHLPGGQRFQCGEVSGNCNPEGATLLSIPVAGLEQGTYHLDITALVFPEGSKQPDKVGCGGFLEGLLIHVYSRESSLAE